MFYIPAFVYAAWKANLQIIQCLFEYDNSIINDIQIKKETSADNQVKIKRYSCLFMSLSNIDYNVFYFFIKSDFKPNSLENQDDFILERALGTHRADALETLLKIGYPITPSANGTSLLKYAIDNYCDDAIPILLKYGEVVDATTFARACKLQNANMAQKLVNHISDEELNKEANGEYAIHWICNLNNVEVAKIVLNRGIDLNRLNNQGKSGFSCLISFKNVISMMELLYNHGFNVNIVQTGNSILGDFLLNISINYQAIEWLLKHGASVDSIIARKNITIREYIKNTRNKRLQTIFKDYLA